MRCLIYSDVHISQDSSIVKQQGINTKYSTRLNHIIKSLNWAEALAEENDCKYIFNLGDTFDKPIINAMEATAIQEIKWANIPHFILVGNHDSDVASLEYSSVNVLRKLNFNIIDKPLHFIDKDSNVSFIFLPYISETNRKKFVEYGCTKNDIVLSHNDIAGFNFGGFISKDGFNINDIKNNSKLFLNGHLHNSSFLDKNILNVGNLCGQNFSEDAFTYKHGCWILDTDDMSIDFIENPFALNFYQLAFPQDKDKFYLLSFNAVLSIKCNRKYKDELNDILNKFSAKIVTKRVIYIDEEVKNDANIVKLEKVDYLKEFSSFVLDNLGNSSAIKEELGEICK